MLIYWIALALTCFLSYILIYFDKKKRQITQFKVFLSFLPLFLVELFRWNVGIDTVYGSGYYYHAYNAIMYNYGNIYNYEIGFYSLMKVCSTFHINLYGFYCLATCIFYYYFTWFLSRNTNKIILSSIIFVLSDLYLFTFSTLRQSLGIAFSLYPITMILREKQFYRDWKVWGYILLSISMHNSMIYLFFIIFISTLKIKKRSMIIWCGILCAMSPFLGTIFERLISWSPYFKKYFGSNMFINSFSITYFSISLILFIVALINYKKLLKLDSRNYILVNICCLTTIMMANSELLVMPYRIFPLFVPIYIILCSKVVTSIKRSIYTRVFTRIYIIVPFLVLFLNQYYWSGGGKSLIYHSIFENIQQVFS